MKLNSLLLSFAVSGFLVGCSNTSTATIPSNYERAVATLDAVYNHYSVEESALLRENYPFVEDYRAGYLASEEEAEQQNPYSYLWPFSGGFSAVVALCEAAPDKPYASETLKEKVLPGLEMYHDNRRSPDAYASYIKTAPLSDRFYDDNVWLGLDFTDLYKLTNNKDYLDKALHIWNFIESGTDEKLGGGIYWCEQKKHSKNTCSNAPGSVFALKLFEATGDSTFFHKGHNLYTWTKTHLQDPSDKLYFDNIGLNGELGRAKFTYNSGQMLQSAALLYKLTGDENYLQEARDLARASYNHFFEDFKPSGGEKPFRLLKETDIWFIAVMSRGFFELCSIDGNREYIDAFQRNLDYSWKYGRDENGLFSKDWTGKQQQPVKWLLHQFGMAELYARMAMFS